MGRAKIGEQEALYDGLKALVAPVAYGSGEDRDKHVTGGETIATQLRPV